MSDKKKDDKKGGKADAKDAKTDDKKKEEKAGPSKVKVTQGVKEGGLTKRERKEKYVARLLELLHSYKNILVVGCDNVGSNQMQKTRIALRGKAQILMGKNTIIRKVVREQIATNPKLEPLLPLIFGNVGLVFTNHDLKVIRTAIVGNKVPAAAKVGATAPNDVFIPPGPTGMDPGQTAFFQALNIATKIVKGAIEIINTVHLIKLGDKITASHVALLTKLNVLPFFYGFTVTHIFEDGTVYSSSVLDVTNEQLIAKFLSGVGKVAAVSLAIGYPTLPALPHLISGTFKKLLAISLATDIEFAESKQFKEMAANPDKFKAAAAPEPVKADKKAAEKPKEKEKPKEEEEEGFGGLFD